jgi:hypothetical protein
MLWRETLLYWCAAELDVTGMDSDTVPSLEVRGHWSDWTENSARDERTRWVYVGRCLLLEAGPGVGERVVPPLRARAGQRATISSLSIPGRAWHRTLLCGRCDDGSDRVECGDLTRCQVVPRTVHWP